MNTFNQSDLFPEPGSPLQPACPAFTRWMQRRVWKGIPSTHRTAPAQHGITTKPKQTLIHPTGVTPPSDEELLFAARQDLQKRLRCKNIFLQHVLDRLQQDPLVSEAWLTPLPRPERIASTKRGHLSRPLSPFSGALDPADRSAMGSSVEWVRPIDEIWTVALQAARDPMLANHERELAFVVALVQPLLEDSTFRFGYTHEDLSLQPCIKAARQASTDYFVSEFETQEVFNDAHVPALAVLLKSLWVPQLIDFDVECVDLMQRERIWRAVDRSMQVLRVNWADPEPIRPLARTCLTPQRYISQQPVTVKSAGRVATPNRGAKQ